MGGLPFALFWFAYHRILTLDKVKVGLYIEKP